MGDRETHDFMTVDSFSQLPFIRRDNNNNNKPAINPPIRLFGFDFPPPSNSPKRRTSSPNAVDGGAAASAGEALCRKFECNYCFRNFPTSQALGGHQNAHKRERQNAKRANAAVAGGGGGQLQNFLGWNGGGGGVPAACYPSWSFSGGGVRFYGGLGSVARPINGNPMTGIWTATPTALLRMGQERRTASTAGTPSRDGVSLDLRL